MIINAVMVMFLLFTVTESAVTNVMSHDIIVTLPHITQSNYESFTVNVRVSLLILFITELQLLPYPWNIDCHSHRQFCTKVKQPIFTS